MYMDIHTLHGYTYIACKLSLFIYWIGRRSPKSNIMLKLNTLKHLKPLTLVTQEYYSFHNHSDKIKPILGHDHNNNNNNNNVNLYSATS